MVRWIFALVVAAHGLVHLIGVNAAFGSSRGLPAQAGSRPQGVLWLLAALLFLGSAGLVFSRQPWWWALALPAAILSEVLIIGRWRDARFGTVANVVVCVPVLLSLLARGPASLAATYRREVERRIGASRGPTPIVGEAELAPLPAAVRAYLRHVGVLGKPRVNDFRARFRGEIRGTPEGGFMPLVGEQCNFYGSPARLFFLEAERFGVPFDGLHMYVDGAATMRIRLASLFPIVDARGPEMNRSETVTMFNDMCILAPATLIDPGIQWQELAPLSVRATFSNAGNTISATLSFNERGELIDFSSDDRDQTADGKIYRRFRWSTPLSAYRDFGVAKLASRGQAIWHMPQGELVYLRYELLGIEYNRAN